MAVPIFTSGRLKLSRVYYSYDISGRGSFSSSSNPVTSSNFDSSTSGILISNNDVNADSLLKVVNLTVSAPTEDLSQYTSFDWSHGGGYVLVSVGVFSSSTATTPICHIVKDMKLYPGQSYCLVDREDAIYLPENYTIKGAMVFADGDAVTSNLDYREEPYFTFMAEEYSVA